MINVAASASFLGVRVVDFVRECAPMPCARCEDLELRFLNRTEEYVSLVERQSRMFRNGEAQAGRDLNAEITEAKSTRAAALKELRQHEASHQLWLPPPLP